MSVAGPLTLFDLAQRGMSAQLVRMNAAASNLANAGTVSGSEDQTYRPIRAVFAEELDQRTGLSTVRVAGHSGRTALCGPSAGRCRRQRLVQSGR